MDLWLEASYSEAKEMRNGRFGIQIFSLSV